MTVSINRNPPPLGVGRFKILAYIISAIGIIGFAVYIVRKTIKEVKGWIKEFKEWPR